MATSWPHLPTYASSIGDMTVKGLSPAEISRAIDVPEMLVKSCLTDPLLKDYIQEQKEKQQKRYNAAATVKRLLPSALAKIEAIMNDPEAKHSDQLRAAAMICTWAGLGKLDASGASTEQLEDVLNSILKKS